MIANLLRLQVSFLIHKRFGISLFVFVTPLE